LSKTKGKSLRVNVEQREEKNAFEKIDRKSEQKKNILHSRAWGVPVATSLSLYPPFRFVVRLLNGLFLLERSQT
jgi:hypothetical protein